MKFIHFRATTLMAKRLRQTGVVISSAPVAADGGGMEELPMDSVSAFEAICADFPQQEFPQVCFMHQVFQIINDETLARQELELARKRSILRQFDLGRDLGIILCRERDYHQLILNSHGSAADMEILEKFVHSVLQQCTNLCVSKLQLFAWWEDDDNKSCEVALSVLLKYGFLVYHERNVGGQADSLLAFSLPKAKWFVQQIKGGRKDLLRIMERATNQESGTGGGVLKSTLLAKKALSRSALSIEYHIKDLLGAGLLTACATTAQGPNSLLFLA